MYEGVRVATVDMFTSHTCTLTYTYDGLEDVHISDILAVMEPYQVKHEMDNTLMLNEDVYTALIM